MSTYDIMVYRIHGMLEGMEFLYYNRAFWTLKYQFSSRI